MQTTFEAKEKIYTEEEYLEMEKQSLEKHEFYNGKIVLVAGTTGLHSLIAMNFSIAIGRALEERTEKFLVHGSGLKIHIPRLRSFVYRDALVVAEELIYWGKRRDTITNPLLVVEVASPSTARYDRTGKFRHYKSLPSFREYVIVEQDFPYVITSYKTADKTWTDTEADNFEQSILLQSINCTIDLKKIYRWVDF